MDSMYQNSEVLTFLKKRSITMLFLSVSSLLLGGTALSEMIGITLNPEKALLNALITQCVDIRCISHITGVLLFTAIALHLMSLIFGILFLVKKTISVRIVSAGRE